MAEPNACEQCGLNWSDVVGDISKTFNVCGKCGAFMPRTKNIITSYFNLMFINERLSDAVRLIMKSELVAAVREATTTLETIVKRKSGLDIIGANLMDQAFRFEYDRKNNTITHAPLIKLNNLESETKRNEQDGVRLIAMGIMRGIRNIFAHSEGTSKFYYALNIITMIDVVLEQIEGRYGTIAEDRSVIAKDHN